ncbi:hypothetical protein [Flavisolibacter tropicus]|uniref:Uncharacterized protein n=1 Tax=Flavisolibacter tropicus TaxID=1492898 RepID=A0A172TY36_9BACT|nr:hypothetical protein [Flavisolibacter tropicus]ANE51950.1 hypothetical protein SY85_17080 [Flavisolibacter tropicus]
MVDTESRSLLAENFRRLIAGQITNFEFEEATFGVNTDDRAIKDLIDVIWTFYDDLKEHKLDVAAFSQEDYKTCARFILFLKSGQEYQWPKSSVFDPFVRLLSKVFTLGIYTRKKEKEFVAAGDINYWPFLNAEDFEQAKKRPKYLNGNAT